MIKLHFLHSHYFVLRQRRRLAFGSILLLLAMSCSLHAAAQAEGSQRCAACHKNLVAQFTLSVHSRLASFELNNGPQGCEACHGSGTRHAKTASAKDIVGFKEAAIADVEKQCLGCHTNSVGINWKHSDHSMHGVTCIQCHKIHGSRPPGPEDRALLKERSMPAAIKQTTPMTKASLAKPEAVLCVECHKIVGSKMMLSSRHPVREGKMNCSSCHAVHGADNGNLRTVERQNDLCLSCHTSKQGPFVFDHSPVSESCSTCHVPHGSVANNLLKQNEPFLCLQCHEAHFHIGRTGIETTATTLVGSSRNPFGESGFRRAFGTKCTQCHSQVHGSNMPGQSVTGRGKSLTR
ncbi:MAG: cytochrome C [Acidobacteria bacterium]|nr:cytochrome C [Acidobacteriota bacterium]